MARNHGNLRNDPAWRVESIVLGYSPSSDLPADVIAAVDPESARWMAEHLADAARFIHRLRQQLLVQAGVTPQAPARLCEQCTTPMRGRSDKRFCSPACRQRAHRCLPT